MNKTLIGSVVGLGLFVALGVGWTLTSDADAQVEAEGPTLTVYKSPSCGCCGDWMKHMERVGFNLETKNVMDINAVKQQHGISPRQASCHTAVSPDGYFFEGHIPAGVVKRFLANPPKGARGLTAPGMPMGSPGMEMGRFVPYDILVVNENGMASVFERVETPDYE